MHNVYSIRQNYAKVVFSSKIRSFAKINLSRRHLYRRDCRRQQNLKLSSPKILKTFEVLIIFEIPDVIINCWYEFILAYQIDTSFDTSMVHQIFGKK